jgi:hypothetical protein
MADNDLRPIQVFLDTKRFIEVPEPQKFVPGTKDFFKGNDRGFAEHKTKLKSSVQGVANSLRRGKQEGCLDRRSPQEATQDQS